ncbi:MAG: hypothetical protein HC841_08555 [Verrucomicrobiae bacterium]|nr:hypothetical protein [Verrucomicrobiae bacterium]
MFWVIALPLSAAVVRIPDEEAENVIIINTGGAEPTEFDFNQDGVMDIRFEPIDAPWVLLNGAQILVNAEGRTALLPPGFPLMKSPNG